MVMHLVLYRPKPGLDAAAREAFARAILAAREGIPAIRRFTVGRTLHDAPDYQLGVLPEFPYVASIEFEDRAGLLTYLQHPSHAALGQAFRSAVDATLVYDYEAVDAKDADRFVREGA